MKNKTTVRFTQWLGFIIVMTVIGLSFAACGDDGGDGKKGTAPAITTATLPGGTVGTAYSRTLAATGDTPVTWSVSAGTLPVGLTLQSDTISGTPTAARTSTFTVKATNAAGSDTKEFSITITGGGNQETAPRITTPSLPGGTVGTVYSRTLTATGAVPITWSIDSGTLPAGLTLQSGTISGTPTTEGISTFTVRAANATGSNTKSLSITITGGGGTALIEMVQIQGGTFQMGSPENEPNHYNDETQHSVTLTGFYMGKYPVTQEQYEAVMENNPSNFKTPVSPETSTANRPVEYVTWYDAVEFCNKLSEKEGLTPVYTITGRTPATGYPITDATVTPDWSKNGYRLPTEAQWEYACRAGTTTAYNTGATISENTGWYYINSGNRTHNVGEKTANAWDLYDMHGNVWEWCWDWYSSSYYSSSPAQDPTGAVSGYDRVRRGGSWGSVGQLLRSAYRSDGNPYGRYDSGGFRLVRPE